jgi:iron complex transport system substrate-binding protein
MFLCKPEFLFILFFSIFVQSSAENYRIITDVSGRDLRLPVQVKRVYGVSPPVTNILMTIAPEVVIGLNFPLREEEKRYLPDFVQNLPVVGGWFGQGRTPNFEAVLAREPEVAIGWHRETDGYIEDKLTPFNIPFFHINLESLHDYPQAWQYLGRLLNKTERAEQLSVAASAYLSRAMDIAGIFKEQSPSVYYAEGLGGLQTECPDSVHIQPVVLMGGRLVHQCTTMTHAGMVTVSREKVLLYDPDIILVHQAAFFHELSENAVWQDLRAVRNKRFFLIPSSPFNWLDRPPSFMRLLGILWLCHVFYGQPDTQDLLAAIKDFYRLFLNWELSDADIAELLKNSLPEYRVQKGEN